MIPVTDQIRVQFPAASFFIIVYIVCVPSLVAFGVEHVGWASVLQLCGVELRREA